MLYTNFTVKVQNNGKFTQPIEVRRSVHQGGCASVQLFLLCAEVVALELRQCEKIKGIPVEDIVFLLNQYADDMNVASIFEEESIQAIFDTLERFRINSGFTVSYEKTAVYRMGTLVGSNATVYTASEVAWTDGPINVLGIDIYHDKKQVNDNYNSLIEKAKATLAVWKSRNLSLIGRITVINTLIASFIRL